MNEAITATVLAVLLLAVFGMVSMRRWLLAAAYRTAQGLVGLGVAASTVFSSMPQWSPPQAAAAIERLRPAFGDADVNFWLVLVS